LMIEHSCFINNLVKYYIITLAKKQDLSAIDL
jgi:hypothetical protein